MILDETHDPARISWVASANGHADFPIQNLPFGVFSPPGGTPGGTPRGGVAIGDRILDLSLAARSDLLSGSAKSAAEAGAGSTLNPLLGLAPAARRSLRHRLSELLADGSPYQAQVETWLHATSDCVLHLPAAIGDYTDF